MGTACPHFMEKTFASGSKTVKFVNVFSLENFALYSMFVIYVHNSPMCLLVSGTNHRAPGRCLHLRKKYGHTLPTDGNAHYLILLKEW